MYPELLHVGAFTLRTYTLLSEIGILVGLVAAYKVAKRHGLGTMLFVDAAIWTLIAGIAGARLYYVVVNWELERFADEPLRILHTWQGGLVFQGALIGAALAMIAYHRVRRQPFLLLADVGFVALPLGHSVGRWGCFFQGCCYGQPTDLPWGVRFPFLAEPVHPTMVYESIANLFIFLILWQLDKRKPFHGFSAGLYLILYSVVRFFNEFLRGDPSVVVAGLRLAQWASVGSFLIGAIMLLYLRQRSRTASTVVNGS